MDRKGLATAIACIMWKLNAGNLIKSVVSVPQNIRNANVCFTQVSAISSVYNTFHHIEIFWHYKKNLTGLV